MVLSGLRNQQKLFWFCPQVSTQEMCLLIPLLMEFKVAKVQEATVTIYDYYEPSKILVLLVTRLDPLLVLLQVF